MTDDEKLQEFMEWFKSLIEKMKGDFHLPE